MSMVDFFLLFKFHVCFYYAILSVLCGLKITCSEKTRLCIVVSCVLSLSHMASRVRCGT